MLITDKESSVDQGQDTDDKNGQYSENEDTEEDEPSDDLSRALQDLSGRFQQPEQPSI